MSCPLSRSGLPLWDHILLKTFGSLGFWGIGVPCGLLHPLLQRTRPRSSVVPDSKPSSDILRAPQSMAAGKELTPLGL